MNDLFRTLHPNTTPSNEDKEVALVAAFQGKCLDIKQMNVGRRKLNRRVVRHASTAIRRDMQSICAGNYLRMHQGAQMVGNPRRMVVATVKAMKQQLQMLMVPKLNSCSMELRNLS
jgi:hypothetical protein